MVRKEKPTIHILNQRQMVERSEKFSHPPKTFATNVNSFATLETRCGLQENKNINDSKQLDDKKPKKRKQISEYVEYKKPRIDN